jgi:hypothetical protein
LAPHAAPALDEHRLVSGDDGLHDLSLDQDLAVMHRNRGTLQQQQSQNDRVSSAACCCVSFLKLPSASLLLLRQVLPLLERRTA